jgi:putative tricarboxylic transport membrane protein
MRRASFLTCVTLLGATALPLPAVAEFVPSQPIELVAHGGPGSGNDVMARRLATIIEQEKLTPVRVQVSNRAGGGSTTASAHLMAKKGDAHTIAVFTVVWVVDPLTQEAAQVRLNDLTPVTRLVTEPALIVVRPDSPYKTLADFIKAAKDKPGQLKQSGGSITSRDNVVRQLLMKNSGADWVYISFPGGGERIAALLGGHVDMMMMDPSEAGEQVRAGKLRVLAQISAQRLADFKDIPTVVEAGFKIPDVPQTRGIVGPPAMPADAVAYYEKLFERLRQTAGWKKFLVENQLEQVDENSAATRAFLVRYEDQLRAILKEGGAKVVR